MASISEIKAGVESLVAVIVEVDAKLDDVAAKIDALQAGGVSQAQLDELAAVVADAQSKAAAVLSEADSLA